LEKILSRGERGSGGGGRGSDGGGRGSDGGERGCCRFIFPVRVNISPL